MPLWQIVNGVYATHKQFVVKKKVLCFRPMSAINLRAGFFFRAAKWLHFFGSMQFVPVNVRYTLEISNSHLLLPVRVFIFSDSLILDF